MAEKTKRKKLRLYKFASEYNLASDTLMEFLQERGHNVKSHMSILTDDMLADIQDHFKKDIELAEQHYKKISEFQKKREDKAEAKSETEQQVVEEKDTGKTEDEEGIATAEEGKSKEETEETGKVEAEVKETPEKESAVEEKTKSKKEPEPQKSEQQVQAETKEKEAKTEKPDSEEVVDRVEAEKEKEEPYLTDYEKQLNRRKKGLKVVGKVDLEKEKKEKEEAAKKKEEEKPKAKGTGEKGKKTASKKEEQKQKEDKHKEEQKQAMPEEKTSEEESAKKKRRKKKKVVKEKKKPQAEAEKDTKRGKKKKRRGKKLEVDEKEVEEAIKRTMSSMDESQQSDRSTLRRKKRKEKQEIEEKRKEEKEKEKTVIQVTEFIAVNELANLMNVSVSEVIQKCMSLGLMVSINQRLDAETITLVADEFDFEVEFQEEYTADELEDQGDDPEALQPRPPVVTIMGHVDHGKTSLLDYIRKENVVAGESGGITQHIGAYQVQYDEGKYVTFLDTPGHEAFTAMRARGAKVTDIVVLIVAADDAVMPQTLEAINHSQAAGVRIIVTINKIDRPNSNIDKIKQQLADRNVLIEDWGGKYQSVEVSAKTGQNVDLLLEKILLEAEILELKANPDREARGAIVESTLDKGRGVTATVLVQKGTLRTGDPFVAGNFYGRVRAMFDERNRKVEQAVPAQPVLVLGFEGSPQAGDTFVVVDFEKKGKEIAAKRQRIKREQTYRQHHLITLDEIANQVNKGEVKELPIIVKGDVDGSVEALSDSLMKLSNEEVNVNVIHKGVGGISEGDVLLAAASNAIIVGFHVRPHTNARKLAENQKVDIRLYNVIYDAINEVKSALEGMLTPIVSEEVTGTAEVRDTFKVPKVGTVAGCYVQDGKISRNERVRLFREGIEIYSGNLASLKRFKDDVKEVVQGYECGLNIENFNDVKVGDIIEGYKVVEKKKKLE